MSDERVRDIDREELVRSYRHCRRLAAAANSTFAKMFWLLPHDQRRAMEALYAFARYTDDLADGIEPSDEKRQRLAAWRNALESALGPKSEIQNLKSEIPSVLPALADTAQRFDIPPEYLRQIIAGVEMDLDHAGFATFDELRHYCLHVASAVGLACLAIWGCRDERAIGPATECGIAFQLTNILRDMAEDAARGRMYLPQADLDRFECQPLVADQPPTRPWIELIKFQTVRAVKLYDESAETSRYLTGSGRRMFRMMHATYRALLAQIEREPTAVLSRRLRVSRPQKAWIVLKTLVS
jgi:phytoene synthase